MQETHGIYIYIYTVFSCSSNRTSPKQGFYAIGALKSRLLNPMFEDDLISALEVESLCAVK